MNEVLKELEQGNPVDEYIAEIIPYLKQRKVCNASAFAFLSQFEEVGRMRDNVYVANLQTWAINTEQFQGLGHKEQQLIMAVLDAMFWLSVKYNPPMKAHKEKALSQHKA